MNQHPKEWQPGVCAVPISTLGTKAKQRLKLYLFNLQKGLCFYCDEPVTLVTGPRCWTLDHVDPLQNGGPDDETNVVMACHQCNRAKGCLTPDQLQKMALRIVHFLTLRRTGSVPGNQE
jgi:5-methylcytosine-specific restriction endonuclease McrA